MESNSLTLECTTKLTNCLQVKLFISNQQIFLCNKKYFKDIKVKFDIILHFHLFRMSEIAKHSCHGMIVKYKVI